MREDVIPIAGQRSFYTERIACVKVLSQEHAYYIKVTKRRAIYLEWIEVGRKWR